MLPLLFIILTITLSVLVALQIGDDTTWFTYYTGGMIGLLVSSLIIEFWNKKRRKKEAEEEEEEIKKRAHII